MKKIIIFFILTVSTNTFAWNIFDPKDYDDCILENMKGVSNDVAAMQVTKACKNKFDLIQNSNQKEKDKQEIANLKKHALAGDAEAQYFLAGHYWEGDKVPLDYKEALKWFKLASEQGDSSAAFTIAAMYQEGQGVIKDKKESIKWMKKAAIMGNATAQLFLSKAYESGDIIAKSNIKANMWLNISAANGNQDANKYLNSLESKITPQELQVSQELAKNCLSSNYRGCD